MSLPLSHSLFPLLCATWGLYPFTTSCTWAAVTLPLGAVSTACCQTIGCKSTGRAMSGRAWRSVAGNGMFSPIGENSVRFCLTSSSDSWRGEGYGEVRKLTPRVGSQKTARRYLLMWCCVVCYGVDPLWYGVVLCPVVFSVCLCVFLCAACGVVAMSL